MEDLFLTEEDKYLLWQTIKDEVSKTASTVVKVFVKEEEIKEISNELPF